MDLKEISRTGAHTHELLVTRRTVIQLQHLVESDYWREDSTPLGRIEVSLGSVEHDTDPLDGEMEGETASYYSLSSSKHREELFLRLVSLASQVPPLQAVVAVRALVRLLRAWDVSRSGSLKSALEASLSPVPLSSTTMRRNPAFDGTSYPPWMSTTFHTSSWGKIIDLCCKGTLYLDIIEIILIDIDSSITGSSNPHRECKSEDSNYLTVTVAALAVDSTVSSDFRHSVRHVEDALLSPL